MRHAAWRMDFHLAACEMLLVFSKTTEIKGDKFFFFEVYSNVSKKKKF